MLDTNHEQRLPVLRAFNKLFPDEEAARAWFERARWPDDPFHWNRKSDACLERMALLIRNGIERPLPYAILTEKPA